MSAVSSWITQIVLLILLAIVLELLLPNQSFQRYVKMVIGLVLIVALLNPVVKIFHLSTDQILNQFTSQSSHDSIKNSIKMNKSDIEAAQRAYILKQMAVQMKNLVKEELIDKYDLTIQNIDIKLDDSKKDRVPIKEVYVTLGQAVSGQQQSDIKPVSTIKDITINVAKDNEKVSQRTSNIQNKKTKDIVAFLAQQWQLSGNKISVTVEGGDS